jgi:hypothetical protein
MPDVGHSMADIGAKRSGSQHAGASSLRAGALLGRLVISGWRAKVVDFALRQIAFEGRRGPLDKLIRRGANPFKVGGEGAGRAVVAQEELAHTRLNCWGVPGAGVAQCVTLRES